MPMPTAVAAPLAALRSIPADPVSSSLENLAALFAPAQALAEGALLLVRRAFGGTTSANAAGRMPAAAATLGSNTSPTGTVTVNAADPETGQVTGVLHVTDPDSDPLTYTASAPANGDVSLSSDGSFVYTPTLAARHLASAADAPLSALTDSFTITAADGAGGELTLPVSVPVAPTDGQDVFRWATYTDISAGTNVAHGTVAGSIPFTYTLTSLSGAPTNLVLVPGMYNWGAFPSQFGVPNANPTIANVVTSSNTLEFGTPSQPLMAFGSIGNPGQPVSIAFSAPVQILWSQDVTVDQGSTAAATLITGREGFMVVQLNQAVDSFHFDYLQDEYYANFAFGAAIPMNHAPTATVSVGSPNAATGVVTGTLNTADSDGDPLHFTASTPSKGSVALAGDGSFTYTPTADARHQAAADNATPATQTDTFTITTTDGHGGSTTTTVSVAIAPANTTPTATPAVGDPNPASGAVLGNLNTVDADGDALSFTASAAGMGTVRVDPSTGDFTYSPSAAARDAATAAGRTLTDTFTITVVDGYGATVVVPVEVSVAPVQQPASSGGTTATPAAATLALGVTPAEEVAIDVPVAGPAEAAPAASPATGSSGSAAAAPAPSTAGAAPAHTGPSRDAAPAAPRSVGGTDAASGSHPPSNSSHVSHAAATQPTRAEHARMSAGKSSGKPFAPTSGDESALGDSPYSPNNPAGALGILGTLLLMCIPMSAAAASPAGARPAK